MLKTRIITAIILISAFLPALFMFSDETWAVAMLGLTLLATYEWGALIKLNQTERWVYTAICAALGILAVLFMRYYGFHQFFFKSIWVFFGLKNAERPFFEAINVFRE